jgi:hypothetical protein
MMPNTSYRGITALMKHLGYATYNTGGGCTAWCRNLPDGSYILITNGDNGLYEKPEAITWTVGRYADDHDYGSFIQVDDFMTLAEALATANFIPLPVDTQTTIPRSALPA